MCSVFKDSYDKNSNDINNGKNFSCSIAILDTPELRGTSLTMTLQPSPWDHSSGKQVFALLSVNVKAGTHTETLDAELKT